MAPSTPSRKRPREESNDSNHKVPDTIKRTRFFEAWDTRELGESLRSFIQHYSIARSTANDWLNQRDELSDQAYRTTRKTSDKLGRKSRISKEQCKFIVLKENPLYKEPIEYNIEQLYILVQLR